MNQTSYSDFSKRIHSQSGDRRVPLEVSIEISRRCPLECLHCYNNLPMGDITARRAELSKEEHFKLLDELSELGCLWLLFTGGEIFARKDFLEIYTYAKNKGFLITLFTNGTLINEKTADYLRDWPPFAIEITLYGRTEETYEALTQVPGSFERCMRGVKLLRDRGLPLKLKTVATKVNKHEVLSMRKFVEEELGLAFKFDGLINPRIDCSQSPLAVRLSPEDVVALDLYSPQVREEYRGMAQRELEASSATAARSTVYSCGGGVNSFAIDPYGNMSICVLSHQDTFNIRGGSVRAGWQEFLLKVRTRDRKTISKCAKCRIQSLCSTCPATGELENGDPESPVEFLCEVAHLRARAMGFEVQNHGDCAFCEGGEQYGATMDSAARIAGQEVDPEQWTAPHSFFPILNNDAAGSGCGGCGSHARV